MKDEINKMLGNLMSEEDANEVMSNMFPDPLNGYEKGDVLTVGELKALPQGTVIHLWYEHSDGSLRNDDFVTFAGYDGIDDELCADAFPMPVHNLTDDTPMKYLDNCGWTFTVCGANKV
tara:strand:- start:6769 stop:7125 length:357 start_codon:yes stop_codon:yes gene_type:complete